jgi:S1-C subfamily serine protease
VIVALNGEPMEKASTFIEKIEERQPGEKVVLTIVRDGKQMQVPVTLGTRSSRQ